MSDKIIRIDGGSASFIYDDSLAPLLKEGQSTVTRASHVEPASTVSPGTEGWIADMRPSGGQILTSDGTGGYCESAPPFLDGRPFTLREEALAAELAWLRTERGL